MDLIRLLARNGHVCMSGMVRCGSKNGQQKHTRLKEIGLCAQILSTILDQAQ